MIESAAGTRAGAGDESNNASASESEGETQTGAGTDTTQSPGLGPEAGAQSEGGASSGGGSGYTEEASTGSVYSLQQSAVPVPLRRSDSLDPGTLRPADDPSLAAERRTVPYVHLEATGAGGEQPSDPLSIPWRLRNVIQRYFSPD
jgi:hypothetical protein